MIGLYETYNGALFKDLTPYASDIEYTTNKYGFWYFTCKLRMLPGEIAELYKRRSILHVYYGDGRNTWFEGRLEDVEYSQEPKITAYGYIRSFSDLQVTDVWSTKRVDRWQMLPEFKRSPTNKPNWTNSTFDGKMQISVTKNTDPSNADLTGFFFGPYISLPDKTTRAFSAINFSLSVINKPVTSLSLGIQRIVPETGLVSEPNPNAWLTYPTTSGTSYIDSVDIMPTSGVFLFLFYTSSAMFVGETGDISAIWESVRIGTTPSIRYNTLYADEILKYTVSGIYNLNPNYINPTTTYIQSPQRDIEEAWFEDLSGLDVVDFLLNIPDSNGNQYELKIWENQKVLFRPEKTVFNTWYVSVDSFELVRTLEETYNQYRGVYSKKIYPNEDGVLEKPESSQGEDRIYRTNWYNNTQSIKNYGLVRQATVKLPTDSHTTAQTKAQQLASMKPVLQLKSSIPVSYVLDSYGSKKDARLVRSGDKIIILNVPAPLVEEIENTFWVEETKWDENNQIMTITPEAPIDTLATIVGGS